jgi:hypothetical protein
MTIGSLALTALVAVAPATASSRGAPRDTNAPGEYGPFFEDEAPSDTAHAGRARKGKAPVLSIGRGAFCFVEGTHCRSALLLDAGIAAGMRVPASDAGPDIPYAQFSVRAGFTVRPLAISRRTWNPWGLGVVGSWSRGTGSVTGAVSEEDSTIESTDSTDAWRVGLINQIWLSRRPYGLHFDFTIGAVRSSVLTSGVALWGTHAEVAFGWEGWAALFAGGDFLDRDSRLFFGMRAHGIAAAPLIALAIAGFAAGGAL